MDLQRNGENENVTMKCACALWHCAHTEMYCVALQCQWQILKDSLNRLIHCSANTSENCETKIVNETNIVNRAVFDALPFARVTNSNNRVHALAEEFGLFV